MKLINSQTVTWILVIVGWLIVNHQNNRREERKEIRSSIDKIKGKIEALEDLALKFHTGPTHDSLLSSSVLRAVQIVSSEVSYLRLIPLYEARLLKDFRRACTLRNFDASTFEPQSLGGEISSEITRTKLNLIDQIEQSFIEKYRSSLWLQYRQN